jgi:hypothetical protein
VIDQIRAKLAGSTSSRLSPRRRRTSEIPNQYLDSSKTIQIRVAFDEGLDQAVEWYREHMAYLVRLGYGALIGD